MTVKVIPAPSAAEASAIVSTAGSSSVVRLALSSSLRIVPVAVSVAVTVAEVPETARLTVNVSSGSTAPSSVVATVKVFASPAVPAKLIPAVFSV